MKDVQEQHRLIDKSEWDRGVWQDEPDELRFTDDVTGYPVVIIRGEETGALAFRVGVKDGHAAHGMAMAPTPTAFVANREDGGHGELGHWWFGYRFDLPNQGRPAQKMNLSLYHTLHSVQDAAVRLCRELKEFDDARKAATRQTDLEDFTTPSGAAASGGPAGSAADGASDVGDEAAGDAPALAAQSEDARE